MPGGITIVGLGPGDPTGITVEGQRALEEGADVWVRTRQHPAASALAKSRVVHSFDDVYEQFESFDEVYQAIVSKLIELAQRDQGVVYAVPGDPMVGEATTMAIRERATNLGLAFQIIHAPSFVEPTLALLGFDALDGLQLVDGLVVADRHVPPMSPDRPALIAQVYSRLVASGVKLALLAMYPPAHRVTVVDGAGTESPAVETVALEELDRADRFSPATSLFVPPRATPSSFERFLETIAHLRAPDGCPWDREQTHETLRPHLLEEAYETLEAIDASDPQGLKEELGDLLLQVVLHAQIASEADAFTMADVIAAIQDKIVRRHPHVFEGLEVEGVDQVLHNWEGLKAEERNAAGGGRGALDGVPQTLPALSQSLEIQSRAARIGFDWPTIDGVRAKVDEELAEVDEARGAEAREGEIGDLLFAVVNLARWMEVDPESALRQCNQRFRARFGRMEMDAAERGESLATLGLERLETLWERSKRQDRRT